MSEDNFLVGFGVQTSMYKSYSLAVIMATEALGMLRSKILELSVQDRAELAHDLIQSLDRAADKGVTEAWRNEVLRRIEQVDAGQAKLLDRAEFNRRVREHIGTQ